MSANSFDVQADPRSLDIPYELRNQMANQVAVSPGSTHLDNMAFNQASMHPTRPFEPFRDIPKLYERKSGAFMTHKFIICALVIAYLHAEVGLDVSEQDLSPAMANFVMIIKLGLKLLWVVSILLYGCYGVPTKFADSHHPYLYIFACFIIGCFAIMIGEKLFVAFNSIWITLVLWFAPTVLLYLEHSRGAPR